MGMRQSHAVEVDVWPSSDGSSEFGATVRVPGDTSTPPVDPKPRVWVVRPTSATTLGDGYDTTERRLLIATDFPYGAKTVVGHEGRLWDVVDEPLPQRGMSRTVKHVTATIVARTGAPR